LPEITDKNRVDFVEEQTAVDSKSLIARVDRKTLNCVVP
jgi:hypothetical protein